MNRFTKLFLNLMVLAMTLGLAVPALAGDAPTPTATPTAGPPTGTPTATATAVPPTPTATATATAVPPTPTATATATAVPPTPTATATPTAGPPTPTATATATATATPTAAPTCSERWQVDTIITMGKGQSPSNNPKVIHAITGNIVDPGSLGDTAHRIPVCAGTVVTIEVTDQTGTPTNTADGSLTCDSSGCSGVVRVTEKYKSVSQDGKDTDRMTLLPK